VDTVVDGAKVIDNLVDSSKIVDKVNDAGKAVDNISDVSKGIDATKQTSNVASEVIEGGSDVIESLTRAQKRNVETLNNVIENNLKEHDFSGTLRDLQGNPVPNPNGGFWDHKTEMIQSYDALTGVKKGLEGSLKNPNLTPEVSEFLQGELNKANSYIQKIDDLFEPYGGVK
jgi:hypothetical protein